MTVPKIRHYFKFEDNLGGQAPWADPVYSLVRRQDSAKKELAEIEKEVFKFCIIEPDPESASGYGVRIADEKQFNELQKRKQNLKARISKIDQTFDSIDKFLEQHPEAEAPKVKHIRSRADYWRVRISDKRLHFEKAQMKIPEKVMAQIREGEAKAASFDAIASEIEKLARE